MLAGRPERPSETSRGCALGAAPGFCRHQVCALKGAPEPLTLSVVHECVPTDSQL